MSKIVDIYMPLDERDSANAAVWPVAQKQLKEILTVIEECGWTANVLNPDKPAYDHLTHVARGSDPNQLHDLSPNELSHPFDRQSFPMHGK